MSTNTRKLSHLAIIDVLRGTAALAVCLFHFTRDGRTIREDHPVSQAGAWGWLGVEVFFVISGFVIPYSMHMKSYRITELKTFMFRRLKRLEPPYLASIAVFLLLPAIAKFLPQYRGGLADFTFSQLAGHFVYANAVLGYEWFNPAYWTLAIEFQYYFFLGFLFPIICSRRLSVSVFSVLCMGSLGFLPIHETKNPSLLLNWLPLFAMGISVCQYLVGAWSLRLLIAVMISVFTACTISLGVDCSLAGVIAAAIIVVLKDRSLPTVLNPVASLGTISYSLYLLHEPIGNRIGNLVARVNPDWRHSGVCLVLMLAGSLVAAIIFWFFVEVPSQRWSRASA